MLSGHGNDLYNYPDRIHCDFSSNIPYKNASGTIADYLSGRMDGIANYPDPNARELTLLLADFHSVAPEQILVTNGSAEAFYYVARLFMGKRSTITYPAFAEYEDACRSYQHELSFAPLDSLTSNTQMETDTMWLGVPNNPDGKVVSNSTIVGLCKNNPHVHFIVDAAYDDLCPREESVKQLQGNFKNLITIHSLTKTFGIPGLRLGYIVADRRIIDSISTIRPPWSVNSLALEAGCFIMENRRDLLPDTVSLCMESAKLQQTLSKLPQLEITPSPCNFFLVRMKERCAAELKQYLIDQFGILIRDASNFRGLTPQHFRLSVQEEKWNLQLIKALRLFFNS